MSQLLRATLALLSLCLLAPLASAQKFEDKRFGYELRIPKEWSQIPIKANEEYIIAKFLAKEMGINDPSLRFLLELENELDD